MSGGGGSKIEGGVTIVEVRYSAAVYRRLWMKPMVLRGDMQGTVIKSQRWLLTAAMR